MNYINMNKIVFAFCLIIFSFRTEAQVEHIDGQTKLINPTGRTLLIEKGDDDSWLTFHDPGQFWYSLGIDKSNSGAFSLNYGGELNSSQFVLNKNGNVGIGTTVPSQKLDVNGSAIFDHKQNRYSSIRLGHDTNDRIFADNSPNKYYGGGLFFRVHNEELIDKYIDVMMFSDNGNVGIGTRNPDSKLAVNGKIHAKEVKVDLVGWPDYVFKDEYNLPSLKEVEQHIQEKGHLQNIPSANEVEENGVLLGEMNKKLLEKIEELTLYTIAQEKQLTEQEEINKTIQVRLDKLEELFKKK